MKKITLFTVTFALSMMFASCKNEAQLSFKNTGNQAQFEYAQSELTQFLNRAELSRAGNLGIRNVAFNFHLNPDFETAAFSVDSKMEEDSLIVELTGNTASDALCAAYTFLEKGGYIFDITGPVLPKQFNWEAVKSYQEKIIPAVKKRGIRQHINFPMDLSAWSLNDAKSYIQNLARMRFNYITFHSYPGQWYEVNRKDTTEYAGHFFYGDVHTMPDQEDIKAIAGNEKYFCIPEIEPAFEDKAAKSKKAVEWLQIVISEAKKKGMFVQYSFEPRNAGTNIDKTVETTKAILKQFPMIDALEFITEEAGGWGPRTTMEQTKKTIADHFGAECLNDSIVMKPVRKEQSDLAYNYGQIGHNVKVINYLKENKIVSENFLLKIGVYVVIPEYARPSFYLARKYAPEAEVSIMPGHHSLNVKNNTPKVLRTSEDWDKSIIYSWIEFDGMMYIQQNGISGIQSIVSQAIGNTSEHRANTILYNHWRTAENKITARYAAISGLYGAVNPEKFYQEYAKANGIAPENDFAAAMEKLDEADLISMKNVSGFAFSWKGRWRNGGPVSAYPVDKLEEVKKAYQAVLDQLKPCSNETTTASGRTLLALLDNRIRTTIIYIKAFEKARELAQYNTSKPLAANDKKEYVRICNESLALFDQYINMYAQINADRGCAGNLVSLWHGPMKGIKLLREKNGGVPFDDGIPLETAVDEPPLPIINVNN